MTARLAWNLLRLVAAFSLAVPFSPPPALATPTGGQIGNGTPGSCTEQALIDAVAAGGAWTFACGAAPHTIAVAPALAVNTGVTLMAGVPGQIILSGGGVSPLFSVDDDAALTLQGIILTDGYSASANGGAINNSGGLILNESQVRHSRTGPGYAGGGIYNSFSGETSLTASTVMGNSATRGGGLAGDGSIELIDSAVISNTADQGGGLFGGGLFSDTVVYLTGAVFDGNTAKRGGAIYFAAEELVISGTTLSNNHALGGSPSLGGGLYANQPAALINVRLTGNRADLGGGLYYNAPGQLLSIEAGTLSGNQAATAGGGLHVAGGDLTLLNVTLSGNVAPTGGGLYHAGGSAGLAHVTAAYNAADIGLGGGLFRHASATGALTLARSVVAHNAGGDCAGAITSGGYNRSASTACGLGGPGDQQSVNPLLKPLASNGGAMPTHLPAAGSPLLGGGPVGGCAAFDQRGMARPTTTACDIGAVQIDPYGPAQGCGGEFPALADATLNQASPNTAAGLAADLRVTESAGGDRWALLNFDLSAIPSGAAIHSAHLRLTLAGDNPGPLVLAAQEVATWTEAAVTWNTAPAGGAVYHLPQAEAVDGVLTLDVSALVTRRLNADAPPGGLALQPPDDVDLAVIWHSREGASEPAQAPQLVVACAPPVGWAPADEIDANAGQAAAAGQLAADSTEPISLQFVGSAVRFGSFRLTIPGDVGADPLDRAQWFLENFHDLLRLDDPASELQLERISDDGLHLFFRQVHAGVPVFPASLVVHLDGPAVTGVSGGYVPGITLAPEPILTAARAEALALAAGGPEAALSGDTQLRYLSLDLLPAGLSGLYLAWVVRLLGGGQPGDYFVDALSGQLLFVEPTVQEGFDLDLEDGNGEAADELCGLTDDDNIGRNDLPPDSQRASDHFRAIYDFWRNTFGRDSYDDDGEQIEVNLNVTYDFPNASYGLCDLFFVGPNMAALDILGHEYSHAVDESASELVYVNQSGALDESFADIFGYLVDSEDWLMGEDAEGADPPTGGSGCSPTPAMRDISNPPCYGQPDHMIAGRSGDGQGLRELPPGVKPNCDTNDCGFVHTNSGIPNKAAALIIQGGSFNTFTIAGLGRAKAQQLFYRVLVYTLSENAQFIDARNAAVYVALTFARTNAYGFTAANVCAVRNAYAAVGLGSGDRDCDGEEDIGDPDLDGDRAPNVSDNCPTIWNPGQINIDGDGEGDVCDSDIDGDIKGNGTDNCPTVANPSQDNFNAPDPEGDACDDTDGDGRLDIGDNCKLDKNPGQENLDLDREGDACDHDMDGDGWFNEMDNCPRHANVRQEDSTELALSLPADGLGDACDLCPGLSSADNRDLDGDGQANPCDADDDGDGYLDVADNCPETYSLSQLDWDHDNVGFVCDPDEQAAFGGILSNVNQSYVRVKAFRAPLPICFACTGGYLPPTFKTVINLSLPIAYQARVVNSFGQVVAKSIGLGAVKTLTISPLAFAATLLAGQSAQALAGGDPDLPLTEFGPEAVRYYLIIEAAPGTDLEQAYPLSVQIVQTTLTEVLFLPLINR